MPKPASWLEKKSSINAKRRTTSHTLSSSWHALPADQAAAPTSPALPTISGVPSCPLGSPQCLTSWLEA